MNSADLVVFLTSSAVGFGVGYGVCWMIMRRSRPPDDVGQFDGRTILGVILLLLVAASIALFYSATAAQQRATACQAQFNAAFRAGIADRTDAAGVERAAQRKFLAAMLQGPAAQHETAYREYLSALDAAAAQRNSAALPPVNSNCGGSG